MVMATTGTSICVNSEDPWGQPTTPAPDPSRRAAPKCTHVPDDWDADEEEEEPDPKELWEIANSRAPMPEIQLSTTTSSVGTKLPPTAAFEAPLRILKRPSSANSKSTSSSNGAQAKKTFKEREAQYQAARERIFGDDACGKDKERSGSRKSGSTPSTTTGSSIIRDPIGPTSRADSDSKRGFRARRRKNADTVTPALASEGGDAKR